jgi:uncharacterized cupredoxin-like copper-binding protein
MKKISIVMLIVLVFSVLLTACGGSGTGDTSTTLRIDMSEFAFEPETLTVPAGQQIRLDLKNIGSIEHDFIILKKGVVLPGKFDHHEQVNDVYFHAMLDAGKADTFTFTAPTEPGEYQVICGIAGHFQAGMFGSLTVVAP